MMTAPRCANPRLRASLVTWRCPSPSPCGPQHSQRAVETQARRASALYAGVWHQAPYHSCALWHNMVHMFYIILLLLSTFMPRCARLRITLPSLAVVATRVRLWPHLSGGRPPRVRTVATFVRPVGPGWQSTSRTVLAQAGSFQRPPDARDSGVMRTEPDACLLPFHPGARASPVAAGPGTGESHLRYVDKADTSGHCTCKSGQNGHAGSRRLCRLCHLCFLCFLCFLCPLCRLVVSPLRGDRVSFRPEPLPAASTSPALLCWVRIEQRARV